MAKRFKCDICNKKFSDKYNLSSHKSVHTTDTPFACPLCPYRGKTKKYLSRHTRQVHKERTGEHKCNVCGKLFLHQSSLKVHAMVHTGEKPHECNVCGKTFRVTYSLNSHMLIHTNEKPFACSFCDYACRDSSTLRKHQSKHMGIETVYECKICNKEYKSRAALKIHIGEKHLNVDVRKFPCDQCDKMFKTNAHRKHHSELIHARSLVCTCPVCGRRLTNRSHLTTHMRTHLDERPFSCTVPGCSVSFKDKSSLAKHSVIHDPSVHFACSHCGRKFARKSHVQRHERVMHEERRRKVECDYCGVKFYSKNYLSKHIQTKHVYKEKFKYICDMCGLVTHNKPSIVMHLKYGHSNDHDMQCKICDNKIVYKRHMYLKLHYWNTHNIKYKITRKGTNTRAKKKDLVEVKVEPLEDLCEEIQLMDVHKEEQGTCSLQFSKGELVGDISAEEVDLHDLLIRHAFGKREEKPPEESKDGVDEEQNEYVKRRIQQILVRTQRREEERAARERERQEEKERREREREEVETAARRAAEERDQLREVMRRYNLRMQALRDQHSKREQVKIRHFKKAPEDQKEYNTTSTEDDVQTVAEEDAENFTKNNNLIKNQCNDEINDTNSDKDENISYENELKCNENEDNTSLDDTNFDKRENISCENELKCNENQDDTNSDKQENISCENELKCNENEDNTSLDDTNSDKRENKSCENELKCNENKDDTNSDKQENISCENELKCNENKDNTSLD